MKEKLNPYFEKINLDSENMKPIYGSDIFAYEIINENEKILHAYLENNSPSIAAYSRNVQRSDIEFYQDIFSNPEIMNQFGDGQIRDKEATKNRVENIWIKRFESGQPHGAMTVLNDEDAHIGHYVAGGGDDAGVSEIAYLYIPKVWGKGIGSKVVENIVNKWGPEVKKIGEGTNLDELQHMDIIENFRCFGEKKLERFDATASPANVASWKILIKNGFHAAKSRLNSLIKIDLDDKEFKNYNEMEEYIIDKFYNSSDPESLKPGIRYLMTDHFGEERTISKHEKYERLKYHFEREV